MLYNKQIYWPKEIESNVRMLLNLDYKTVPTAHYKSKCSKLGIWQSAYRAAMYGEVIECEAEEDGFVTKIISRQHSKQYPQFDLVFAIKIEYPIARIKTVWLNRRDDNHMTINKSKYVMGD